MTQPLLNDVLLRSDGDIPAVDTQARCSDFGVPKSAQPPSVWKSVILRVILSGVALFGLAGVGAASMLAGLDGAHANPPHAQHSKTPDAKNDSALASASPAGSASAATAPSASASNQTPPPVNAPCPAGRTTDGKVILNLATSSDLRTLPGIGQKRAAAILALRDRLKRFRRIQELRRVRGIGAKTLQRLAPKLLVDPPPGMCDSAVAKAK
jgi:competence protein ComEA